MKKLLILTLLIISCGPQGIQGPKGDPGLNGQVQLIQLCPESKHDPKTAMCINNNLYIIEEELIVNIPIGTYNEDDCTFTIKENCEVE